LFDEYRLTKDGDGENRNDFLMTCMMCSVGDHTVNVLSRQALLYACRFGGSLFKYDCGYTSHGDSRYGIKGTLLDLGMFLHAEIFAHGQFHVIFSRY
jgi:hypothetical protein